MKSFDPRWLLIVWLLAVACASNAREQTTEYQGTSLSFWKGIIPFGSEKISREAKIEQAFKELSSYFDALDDWHKDMYQSIDAQPNWKAFRTDIEHSSPSELLTLKRDYKHDEHNNQTAWIYFSGDWQKPYEGSDGIEDKQSSFQFRIDKQPAPLPQKRLGEVIGALNLKESTTSDDIIDTSFSAQVFLDTLLFTEALESIEAVNTLFDQSSSLEFNSSTNEAFEQMLRREFDRSLPRLMQTLERISDIEKLARIEDSKLGYGVTRITHQQAVDLKSLKQHFPDTYRDFKTLLKSASFNTQILTADNKRIAQFEYDAESHRFYAEFVLAKGGFMLQNQDGELLDDIIYPTQIKALDYHLLTHAKISLFGLSVDMSNLDIKAQYQADTESNPQPYHAHITMQLNSTPEIKVQGALLYILPKWLIDLLIPGTLETLIADTYKDVFLGRNGEGISTRFKFEENDKRHTLEVIAAAEIPYSLLQGFLRIEEKGERSDRPRLYSTLRKNLRDDFSSKSMSFLVPKN